MNTSTPRWLACLTDSDDVVDDEKPAGEKRSRCRASRSASIKACRMSSSTIPIIISEVVDDDDCSNAAKEGCWILSLPWRKASKHSVTIATTSPCSSSTLQEAVVVVVGDDDVDNAMAVRSMIFSTYTNRVFLRRLSISTSFSSSLNNDLVLPPLTLVTFALIVAVVSVGAGGRVSISLRNLGGAARGHRVLLVPSLSSSSFSPSWCSPPPTTKSSLVSFCILTPSSSTEVVIIGATWLTCNALPEYRPPHPWGQEEELFLDDDDDDDTSKS